MYLCHISFENNFILRYVSCVSVGVGQRGNEEVEGRGRLSAGGSELQWELFKLKAIIRVLCNNYHYI